MLFGTDKVYYVELPPSTEQVIISGEPVLVKLPDKTVPPEPTERAGKLVYEFPSKCSLPRPPVSWYGLALVIGLAVACICLWGTLIGSLLPILFKWRGIDPGIASSPFVATFVDVTGIVIYFMISRSILGI